MKRISGIFLTLCVCILTVKATASFGTEPESRMIPGVSKLAVGVDSIQLTKDDSAPVLDLIPEKALGSGVRNLSVGIGESFTISDGHHVSTAYKLLRVGGGSALIEVNHSTHFPGEVGASRSFRTELIRAYDVEVPGQ